MRKSCGPCREALIRSDGMHQTIIVSALTNGTLPRLAWPYNTNAVLRTTPYFGGSAFISARRLPKFPITTSTNTTYEVLRIFAKPVTDVIKNIRKSNWSEKPDNSMGNHF